MGRGHGGKGKLIEEKIERGKGGGGVKFEIVRKARGIFRL